MIFQSIEYLLFLGALLSLYFWLPMRGQNVLLLAASYVFYGWVHPWYVVLIATTTLFDWGCARGMDASTAPSRRKLLLWVSIGVNLAVLGIFKYLGFFMENVTQVLTSIGLMPSPWVLKIALPAGISFFTFQSISYAVDVYRKQIKACPSLLEYAVFAAFFPQLVAGPIERAGHMLPQYQRLRRPSLVTIRSGFVLVLWGLFQKMAIADSAAMLANKAFAVGDATFPIVWGGVVAFGVQIYADFSGYTAIARGSARLIGIDLCQNFSHPYQAQSPADFWRRWHMSLSNWLRDYVFIPLEMAAARRKVAKGAKASPGSTRWRVITNTMITFFISGLWHGAGWNFIFWGLYHGILLSVWPTLARALPIFNRAGGTFGLVLRVGVTLVLMHVGRLFFRESSFAMILHDLLLNPFAAPALDWRVGGSVGVEALLYGLPLIVIFPWVEQRGWVLKADDVKLHTWRWTAIQAGGAFAILLTLVALRSQQVSDFIYFQF